jgi:hypothetical protein
MHQVDDKLGILAPGHVLEVRRLVENSRHILQRIDADDALAEGGEVVVALLGGAHELRALGVHPLAHQLGDVVEERLAARVVVDLVVTWVRARNHGLSRGRSIADSWFARSRR